MKKKYLAALPLGLALAASGAHAQSSVTLYGVIDTGVQYINDKGGQRFFGMNEGAWAGERFGLKGTEDLGGGLSASFLLEEGYNSDTGAQSKTGEMFNRSSWVGLNQAGVGSLTLGRQYSPYYSLLAANGPTPWLTGLMGAHPGDIDNLDTDYRISNAIEFKSASFAGLQVGAMYALGGVAGSTGLGQSWSLAANYTNGPLSAGAAIERFDNATAGGGTWSASSTAYSGTGEQGSSSLTTAYQGAAAQQRIAATAGYKINDQFDVSASYSNVQYIPGSNSAKASAGGNTGFFDTETFNTFGAVVHFRPVGAVDLAAGYARTHASAANGTSGATYNQFNLTELYNLSKRTKLYALEAFQHASGTTLGSKGTPVAATADIGELSAASGTRQVSVMVGINHAF